MPDADTQVDDDTCITLAMLHGCQFHPSPRRDRWYVDSKPFTGAENLHPVERIKYEVWDRTDRTSAMWGWDSKESLARDYCTFYGLI